MRAHAVLGAVLACCVAACDAKGTDDSSDAAIGADRPDGDQGFACDGSADAAGPETIFTRAKPSCETRDAGLDWECGTFKLTFDAKGRASELTREDTQGPLPDRYRQCILKHLEGQRYECLASTTVDTHESCTLL